MIRSSSSARIPAFLTAGALASAVVFACGGSNPPSNFGDDPDGGGSGGASGSGGTSGSGSGGFGPGSGSGGPTSFDAACASQKSAGQQEPLDLYIMLDQSASMNESNKWTSVTNALDAFVAQQGLQGISVGIQYFALPQGASGSTCTEGATCTTNADCGTGTCANAPPLHTGCFCLPGGGGDSCTPSDYAKPEVEISALPAAAGAITASIGKHKPSTGTPTSAALGGAIQHTQDWSAAHAGHITAVVLATDGNPTGCLNVDVNQVAADGASGAGGKPKILTFVIGVGPSLTALDAIAAAGGTTKAFIVDTNGNAQQQFLDALNAIRGTAAGCQYQIPLPTTGTPNYDQVNVEITPPGKPQVIAYKVANKAACPSTPYNWYYDDNAKPTQIIFCDATCTQVMNDKTDEVDILLGCGSLVK